MPSFTAFSRPRSCIAVILSHTTVPMSLRAGRSLSNPNGLCPVPCLNISSHVYPDRFMTLTSGLCCIGTVSSEPNESHSFNGPGAVAAQVVFPELEGPHNTSDIRDLISSPECIGNGVNPSLSSFIYRSLRWGWYSFD